ncbi:unnamed protein product [Linum trigynum]|uniref:Glutaredoxin domain-containing protein n=1 Tax=Linum trigynum TaxID=586398 RepID=A0AAV2F2P0_9ROSI
MGCVSSKQHNKRCKHCQAPYSPVPRSYSMHVIHPPQHKSDSYHLVALTSSTLGSLKLETVNDGVQVDSPKPTTAATSVSNEDWLLPEMMKSKEEFAMGLIEAKTWSKMIEEKIPRVPNHHPKTPIMTPPGEPETINTWELMEGLEEDRFTSPCRLPNHIRSFSFDVTREATDIVVDSPKLSFNHQINATHFKVGSIDETEAEAEEEEAIDKKPHLGKGGKDYFDSNIISMFRKSMQELSPSHPYHLKKPAKEKDRVIVYFTSLRGVRKTYEDSCYVRVILKGAGVRVDERDVSMHSGFKEELKQLLGGCGGGFSLPRVFIGKKYIGGAEEVRRLHEEGQLEKAVEGCEQAESEDGGGGGSCEACGDIRFVPCETCNGSCKIYNEEEEEEDEELEDEEEGLEGEEGINGGDYGFQRCPDCNENGLIRCPICCY